MKNSDRIKQILVQLAENDRLPKNMNDLDQNLFNEFNTFFGYSQTDIIEYADNIGYELTQFEVDQVQARCEKYFNAENGLTWYDIEYHIEKVVEDRINRINQSNNK